jgi:hypothetical protein
MGRNPIVHDSIATACDCGIEAINQKSSLVSVLSAWLGELVVYDRGLRLIEK